MIVSESDLKWAAKLLGVVSSLSVLLACSTQQTQTVSRSRYWESEYVEVVTVNTEPPACKVYCGDQYCGISPVDVNLKGGKAQITQFGTCLQQYTRDGFSGRAMGHRDIGPISWGEETFSLGVLEWTFRAFKDGYDPGTKVLRIAGNDPVVLEAFGSNKVTSDGKFATRVSGRRSILVALRPLPGANAQQQQQQQQQQTVVVPSGGGAQPAEATGTVIISSNIEGAEIYVDGLFVGNAPAKLNLTGGVHVVEVRKTGYQVYKKDLRVYAGSEVALIATLEQ